MSLNVYSTFHIKDNVFGINLDSNSLESLESTQFPPSLIQLYLSNNKLRKLPESIFEGQQNLKEATLSGNPWKCDCNTVKFMKWLTSEKAIVRIFQNYFNIFL